MSESGTYTSKSGVEIQAVFNNTKFGDLHMIKYATQRDTANVHVMGAVDAVSVARGKRATTGACVFAIFEKDRLLEALGDKKVFLTNHEIINYGSVVGTKEKPVDINGTFENTLGNSGTLRQTTAQSNLQGKSVFDASNYGEWRSAMLIDQIPPFDITLVGISEASGHASRMIIHGVQFNSDQGGSSVDDLLLERQVTFIARRITPWTEFKVLAGGSEASNGISTPSVNSNSVR